MAGSAPIEVIVDPKDLLAVGQALTKLQAENFIRPELETFGKSVMVEASQYPPAGTVMKSSQQYRQEKAKIRAIGRSIGGAFLGKLLAETVSKQSASGQKPLYQRTGNYAAQWKRSTEGLNERIQNQAVYAGYVGGLDASPGGKSGASGNQPYTWRYGWKRLKLVAQEQMDKWIVAMEHKAFRLWER